MATFAERARVDHRLRDFKAAIFRALANPTRIAIVELLRDQGETSVAGIQEHLGVEQANASQHLAVLRAHQIVVVRKAGNQVFYRLRDKSLGRVLDLLKAYFLRQLGAAQELHDELSAPARKPKPAPRRAAQ